MALPFVHIQFSPMSGFGGCSESASVTPSPSAKSFNSLTKAILRNQIQPPSSPQGSLSVNKKRCLRCGELYEDKENSPTACFFHGHATGKRGLLSLAPPHQGIDGEWSDRSGVIVYRWNEKGNRPSTGRANWKKRWSCCAEYGEEAPPCRRGRHVSYDDGFTRY